VKEDSAGEFTFKKGYVNYFGEKLVIKKRGQKKILNPNGLPNKNFEIEFEFKTK